MEESKKKPIMVGIVVACLILAGVITFMSRSESSGIEAFEGRLVWVKCSNSDCETEYQMDMKDYFKQIEERTTGTATPPLPCKECAKESIYRAIKCANEKCGIIFFYGSVPNDFADRCPECGRSKIEEDVERARQRK